VSGNSCRQDDYDDPAPNGTKRLKTSTLALFGRAVFFINPRMEIIALMPGSFYVTDGANALLAGCPPEIVKVIRQRSLNAPGAILLPDKPIAMGESQTAVEFPLYQHLFVGASEDKKPLTLIGSRRRIRAAEELLELTLLGPDESDMRDWGLEPEAAEALARETRWFHPKDDDGKQIPLSAMVTSAELESDSCDFGWIKVRRIEQNVFRLTCGEDTQDINLNVLVEQEPPYPVTTDLTVSTLVKLGVEVLGGATGFSSAQASSGMALCYNGNYVLIDAIPYLNFHLKSRGIARNQIHSIFLTHIHDDHCNLISLLQYNRKIRVLTTPVIFHMMLKKLSLMMDRPVDRLRAYFDFEPLTPGEETDFFGLRILPHYSSHPIPTIGAQFSTVHNGANYHLIYTGDNQSLADIKQMQKTGVIDGERYNEIAELYHMRSHLLIADGGEGVMHGDPADALNSEAERIVFLHLEQLSDEFHAQFTVASSGKRFPILRGDTDYNLTRTIEYLLEYFPEMPPIWISNLLANQQVHSFNAGDIIIRQGSRSDSNVYMILTGYAQVIQHDGRKKNTLAQMEAGELIGEMSIITGKGQRNASVVALSPVTVCAISESAFHGYIRHQRYENKLRTMWQNRELLQNFPYLRPLQQPVIRALSERVTLEYLTARNGAERLENIAEEGGLMFPLGIDIEVERRGKAAEIPAESEPVFCSPGTMLKTEAEFQYLLLRTAEAASLRHEIPAFRYFWEETLGLPVPTSG